MAGDKIKTKIMNQVIATAPKTLVELKQLSNVIKAKSISGALEEVRKYMRLHYNYNGTVVFHKLFLEGNDLVYGFYSQFNEPNHKVYVIF